MPFFALTAGLAAQAQAQLVTYQFTGTSIYGNAGNTIAGEITNPPPLSASLRSKAHAAGGIGTKR